MRTANALINLPKIAAAMERGELSYAKVRALTRVACANTESTLLDYAFHGTAAHVERIVRDFRRCKEAWPKARPPSRAAIASKSSSTSMPKRFIPGGVGHHMYLPSG